MNILVTGASGFVGLPLIKHLSCLGFSVTAYSRNPLPHVPNINNIVSSSIYTAFPTSDSLAGFDIIIHLIARVHHSYSPNIDEYGLYPSTLISPFILQI